MDLKLKFTANIAQSYKRLSYKLWYALAEYVDNSTQAYYNHKQELDKSYENKKSNFFVNINYFSFDDISKDYFEIKDNSYGMDEAVLRRAFNTGQKPENNEGRSKYGLGMKTASFWLGDSWSVETTQLGSDKLYKVAVNIDDVENDNINLKVETHQIDTETHYTNIRIWGLHRKFIGRTLGRVYTYLASIYRYDLMESVLDIIWREKTVIWKDYNDLLIEKFDGSKIRKNFGIPIGEKNVTGWAGVLEKGDRGTAGFALVQNKRVINSNYRPATIFGEQEGGRNDLINQRLIGEIFVDGFEVSHTKDEILWEGEEELQLEEKLKEEISEQIRLALVRRVKEPSNDTIAQIEIALENVTNELESVYATDLINNIEIPPSVALEKSNEYLLKAITNRISEPIKIKVGKLSVNLFTDEDLSPNDPYVITDSSEQIEGKYEINIVFNPNHPHWQEIYDRGGVIVFIRQVVYDGVAEWKAWNYSGKINHDTVKFIKDNLLRVPFMIKQKESEVRG